MRCWVAIWWICFNKFYELAHVSQENKLNNVMSCNSHPNIYIYRYIPNNHKSSEVPLNVNTTRGTNLEENQLIRVVDPHRKR